MKTILFLITLCAYFVFTANVGYSSTVSVQATVLSKSNCRFSTATATLALGNIDITSNNDVTAETNITIRCGGAAPLATYIITHDDGLYESGPNQNRMRHSTIITEFLPYSFTINPATATVPRNTNRTVTLSATVKATDFADAIAGLYNDTVTLSINP